MNLSGALQTAKYIVVRIAAILAILAVIGGALYGTYVLAGPVGVVVYTSLFVAMFTLAPLVINMAGDGVPFNSQLGRGHIVLGAFAYGNHYLVQRENRWEWCPGTTNRVWIDNDWVEIAGGRENKSVLGWRPFGILRYKPSDAYRDVRVDVAAEKLTDRDGSATDGGQLERGGVTERRQPAVSGRDGTWLVDLKRVWSSGVQKIGDIGIIETAEEIIERGQVNDNTITGNPTVTFFVALVLGVVVGFIYVYLMGA